MTPWIARPGLLAVQITLWLLTLLYVAAGIAIITGEQEPRVAASAPITSALACVAFIFGIIRPSKTTARSQIRAVEATAKGIALPFIGLILAYLLLHEASPAVSQAVLAALCVSPWFILVTTRSQLLQANASSSPADDSP